MTGFEESATTRFVEATVSRFTAPSFSENVGTSSSREFKRIDPDQRLRFRFHRPSTRDDNGVHPPQPKPNTMKYKKLTTGCLSSALVLGSAAQIYAADSAAESTTAEVSGPAKVLGQDVPNWIKDGKFNLNARLRYEYAEVGALEDAHAFTLRTRFGYTTGDYHGLKGMVEAENITDFGSDRNYSVPGLPANGKSPVADPSGTEINQYWLSYTRFDTTIKGPRQRIVLDNVRFVGDVGWRQNQQTFDGVSIVNKSLENTTLTYAYLYQINRIFGSGPGGEWDSNSHIFNGTWAGSPYANLTGYAYLLDFEDSSPVNSTDTFGAYVTGKAKVNDDVTLGYRGEFAWQTDAHDSPLDYSAPYYHVNVTGDLYQKVNVGLGYEVLGSDNGQGFRTPLATLHAFNGWADSFLNTPGNGLQDIYASIGGTLPGGVKATFVAHKFDSVKQSVDYGREFDFVLSKGFYTHWSAMLKFAHHDADGGLPDAQRLWAQVEFNY